MIGMFFEKELQKKRKKKKFRVEDRKSNKEKS